MRVLITGHTGFKGSWLALLLSELGYAVSGLSLNPEADAIFSRAELAGHFEHDIRGDIRDPHVVSHAIQRVDPEFVFHLAAQPLVRESYRKPRVTMETNVTGTMNVLEHATTAPNVRGILVVTTDKVYRNAGSLRGYVETDPLGGSDPYSASKAMADLLTQSWQHSFPGPAIGIARAGNVIGGGDHGHERLVPDLIRAFASGRSAAVRSPSAVRPWQHVLDCLNGYYLAMQAIQTTGTPDIWNFGPDPTNNATVAQVADILAAQWGGQAAWHAVPGDQLAEAPTLTLDASKAQAELMWTDHLSLDEALMWTADWERSAIDPDRALAAMKDQVGRFLTLSDH